MKKLGIFILIYNIVFYFCSYFEWYSKAYPIIDLLDIPIYILSAIIFFKSWWNGFKKVTIFEKHCFIASYILLVFKIMYLYELINYNTYEVWFWFVFIAPILLKIERNINYEQRANR